MSGAHAIPGYTRLMSDGRNAKPVLAASVPPRSRRTNYPEPFASRLVGREKRPLSEVFGLTNFGVNLTTLKPGGVSALRHWHTRQDEFIYVLEGEVTLITNAGEQRLMPGMCAGFQAGVADGHHLVNRGVVPARYLEVGDRLPGDAAHYLDVDLAARQERAPYAFTRRDGAGY